MADALQSLRVELARLRKLIKELRAAGHTGIASVLEETVGKVVSEIANLTGAAVQSVTQQQQQVQPDEDDKKEK